MNANFYVGCILARFSGQTHRVRSWTYARFHYEPSTDGPQPLFLETCDFKQQLLSLPRERAQAGKVSEWMQKVGSARLGRAFALLRAIINNDPYEDYKIITPILIPRYLSGGSDWNALLRLAPFGPRSWITSIGPECYSHVMRNIVNTITKGPIDVEVRVFSRKWANLLLVLWQSILSILPESGCSVIRGWDTRRDFAQFCLLRKAPWLNNWFFFLK